MKKLLFAVSLISLLALSGCDKKEEQGSGSTEPTTASVTPAEQREEKVKESAGYLPRVLENTAKAIAAGETSLGLHLRDIDVTTQVGGLENFGLDIQASINPKDENNHVKAAAELDFGGKVNVSFTEQQAQLVGVPSLAGLSINEDLTGASASVYLKDNVVYADASDTEALTVAQHIVPKFVPELGEMTPLQFIEQYIGANHKVKYSDIGEVKMFTEEEIESAVADLQKNVDEMEIKGIDDSAFDFVDSIIGGLVQPDGSLRFVTKINKTTLYKIALLEAESMEEIEEVNTQFARFSDLSFNILFTTDAQLRFNQFVFTFSVAGNDEKFGQFAVDGQIDMSMTYGEFKLQFPESFGDYVEFVKPE